MPPELTLPSNPITRSALETALNEVITNQRGIDFQRIAVRLARERCSALVASEVSKDGGEDAYLVGKLPSGKMLSVASSITATFKKICEDLTSIKRRKLEVDTLWFYTPRTPTNQTIDSWKREVLRRFSVELEVVTREEVASQLLDPRFRYLAYHHLGFPHPIGDEVRETREHLMRSAPERLRQWLTHRLDPRVHAAVRDYVADDGKQQAGDRMSAEEVAGMLISGGLFALWGEGGIGKSVALGQLAQAYSQSLTRPVALLISAPAWARSGQELAGYLSTQFLGDPEQFRTSVMSLLETGQLGVFINGWNEVPPDDHAPLTEYLTNVLHAAPGCPIVLATRSVAGVGALRPAGYFRVLPLSTETRTSLTRQLAPGVLNQLEELTDSDRGVDTLSRLPLFLIPLVDALQQGDSIPRTRPALLEAALIAMERSPDHASTWNSRLLAARVRPALGRIAFELSARGTTEAPRAEVEAWIYVPPHDAQSDPASALLERLIQHHVLEREGDDVIRFQHEYLQDWLCAAHLRSKAVRAEEPDSELAQWIDSRRLDVAWALLIEALAYEPNETEASMIIDRLFRLALDVDVQLAAQWLPAVHSRVSTRLVQELVYRLRAQLGQGGAARHLALNAALAGCLPDFAEELWRQLESPDDRERQELENLRQKIPVEALGPNWRGRLLQWSPERRADFITRPATVASSSDPLALQKDFAQRDPSPWVQAQCIRDIAFEDQAAGDALFAAASAECRGHLLEAGAWDLFSKELIAPYIPLLEELARYPGTTPRYARALAYLADYYPEKAVDTYRQQLQRARPGAPDYDQAFQFVSEHDSAWTAEWLLRELIGGKRLPMNAAHVLRELREPEGLTRALEDILAQPAAPDYSRLRSLALLIQTSRPEIVDRCFQEWIDARAALQAASVPEQRAKLGARVIEAEDALSNGAVDLLVAAAETYSAELQTEDAVQSFARLLARALDELERVDREEGETSLALRAVVERLVASALASDDLSGECKAAVARLIGQTGDQAFRGSLEQLLAAERSRVLAIRSSPTPPASRRGRLHYAHENTYVIALSSLAGPGVVDALLPLVDTEPFELAAAGQLVEELDKRAGRWQSPSPSQTNWSAIAGLHQHVIATPPTSDEQRVAEALRRRIVACEQAAQSPANEPAQRHTRVRLEVLRALVVHHVRAEPLVAVPVNKYNIYDHIGWATALVRGGVSVPAAWVERTLTFLTSPSEPMWLRDDDRTRLLVECVTSLMFSDNPGLATERIRALAADARTRWRLGDLMVPLSVSGIPEQISLMLELVPDQSRDSYWWAWVEALRRLPRTAQHALVHSLLSGTALGTVGPAIASRAHSDLGTTIAAIVAGNSGLRDAVEALARSDEQARDFCRAILAQIADVQAAELLLSIAVSEPTLRPLVGSVLVGARWARSGGRTWPGMSAPRSVASIRKRLLGLTVDPELSLRQWASRVLADIDAAVDGAFPADEPRHPDLASGISWPTVA
jgi:hypothetical protein